MLHSGRIQILPRQLAAFFRLGVVVLESDDPFTRRRLRGSRTNRILNVRNGSQIAIHPAQMTNARVTRVRVRVDESRHHRPAAEIDLPQSSLR
jgi:hypothetical protein